MSERRNLANDGKILRCRHKQHRKRRDNPLSLANNSKETPSMGPQTSMPELNQLYEEEVTVKLRDMPANVTTLEIWNTFSKEGNISKIIMLGNENYPGRTQHRQGKIIFYPPPRQAFWSKQTYKLRRLDNSEDWIKTDLLDRKPIPCTPSPVDARIEYPTFMSVLAESIHFGVMHAPNAMMIMNSCAEADANVRFALDLGRKQLEVSFTLTITDPRITEIEHFDRDINIDEFNRMEEMKFVVPFSQIKNIYELGLGDNELSLVIPLENPPFFFKKTRSIEKTHGSTANWWTERLACYRQTDIIYSPEDSENEPLALRKTKPVIDIGRWTTYRFVFKLSKEDSNKYRIMCDALRDHNVPMIRSMDIKLLTGKGTPVWQIIDAVGYTGFECLSWAIRYQLEVCISQGILSEYNLTREFITRLCKKGERDAKCLLENIADRGQRIFDPMEIFKITMDTAQDTREQVPSHCSWTRSATVTPSMIYYSSPVMETTNRIIRQHIEHSDRFLRVRFSDEKHEGNIDPRTDNTRDEIFDRVKHAMKNGIKIGDRKYEFLAFENSQFREHGAYFFAPIIGRISIEKIRASMGHFTDLRVVSKHIAYMGQCFSATRAIRGARVEVVEIPDIQRNGCVFSDGVGKISQYLARVVAIEMKVSIETRSFPSLFQFRLGGCKGVLAVSNDPGLRDIHVRRSQYKFAAIHEDLEIIRCSQFTSATLNRQLIMVLSSLGVADEVFTAAQKRLLAELERAMSDKVTAKKRLSSNVDVNQMTITIANLISDGFMECQEPFVMSLLHLWRAWSIKYLKEKSRIPIDGGACLLGCLDETGILQGYFTNKQVNANASYKEKLAALPEIFVQVEDHNSRGKGQFKALQGLCILARNPSLHPGDVRVVRAVDVPELHDLRNVIVFPQTGDRDLSSMCSGGDLDGDDYLVIWDKDLIPTEWNTSPMENTAEIGCPLDRDVTNDDIISFFVTYMQNDDLSNIALAHLAWADSSNEGVKSKRCLSLAELHSKAVDYPKTGDPAVMPLNLKPTRWPHFMVKKRMTKAQTYISKKVLGQLYDQVERVDFVPRYDNKFDQGILNAFELDENILRRAAEEKREYDDAMRRIMAQFEIGTEFEIWTSFVLQHSGATQDYKFAEEMGQKSEALKEKYRQVCYKNANGNGFDNMDQFVAAMYTVTHWDVQKAQDEYRKVVRGKASQTHERSKVSMPLISFPWLFSDILGKLSRRSRPSGDLPETQPDDSVMDWAYSTSQPQSAVQSANDQHDRREADDNEFEDLLFMDIDMDLEMYGQGDS